MKRLLVLLFVILCAFAFSQETPVPNARVAAQAKFDGSTLVYSVGPIEVAAHTKAGAAGSKFEAETTIPEEGWLVGLGESPVVHNATDATVKPRVELWNASRGDVLCSGRDERIAMYFPGAPRWPSLEGHGYHVRKNDRVRVTVEIDNPGDAPFQADDIMVSLTLQPINTGAVRQDVWPLWFDTKGCGPSEYDLKPGANISSGSFEMGVDGNLVAIQAALRKYGEEMLIQNHTRTEDILRAAAEPIPLAKPQDGIEWRLNRGDMITVSATYRNPEKEDLPIAATGIALGVMLPADPSQMNAFDRNKAQNQSAR